MGHLSLHALYQVEVQFRIEGGLICFRHTADESQVDERILRH